MPRGGVSAINQGHLHYPVTFREGRGWDNDVAKDALARSTLKQSFPSITRKAVTFSLLAPPLPSVMSGSSFSAGERVID